MTYVITVTDADILADPLGVVTLHAADLPAAKATVSFLAQEMVRQLLRRPEVTDLEVVPLPSEPGFYEVGIEFEKNNHELVTLLIQAALAER